MARLIDADDVINKINAYCKGSQDVDFIRKLVENQTTAYDVEKVVEQLESAVDSYCSDYHGVDYIEPEKAIEYVRKGGVE